MSNPNTLTAPIKLKERKSAASRVVDPLEGVMPGETRHARLVNFQNTVLSAIWPRPTAHGSHNSGEYGDDLHRQARHDEGDLSGFTHFGPFNRDIRNIDPAELENVVSVIGPDYVRVRSVPPQLLDSDNTIIPTGGSCIIETWGMRTTTELRNAVEGRILNRDDLSNFVRSVVDFAPTITHISGGMLVGQSAAVHYNESSMWIERLADYGIPLEEATQITNDAYARINQALLRKAKLVNPSANIINVNFDEVPLHQAIEEWMTNLGIQYDPTKRITEVIQTYVGPHQLELLKQALLRRLQSDHLTSEECFKVVDLLAGNVHLRMKQMDHLRWGSMNLPKEVITGRREPTREELEQMESDYMFSLGVKLMNDVYHRLSYPNAPLAAVGFADLPGYGNAVQHESRDAGFIFVGRPGEQRFLDSIKNQLTHPARLHRGNVKEHLDFIKAYTNDTTATKKTLVSEKSALLNVTSPVTKKMMRRIAN